MIADVLAAIPGMLYGDNSGMLMLVTSQWYLSVVPVVICFGLVHLFFRNLVSVLWFTFKAVLAIGMYLQCKEVIDNSIGLDPFGIETKILGIAAGTLGVSSAIAKEIVRKKAKHALSMVCPMCVSPDEDEPVEGTLFAKTEDLSWMAWARDI
jgi:hypothetical protein